MCVCVCVCVIEFFKTVVVALFLLSFLLNWLLLSCYYVVRFGFYFFLWLLLFGEMFFCLLWGRVFVHSFIHIYSTLSGIIIFKKNTQKTPNYDSV